MFPFLSFFYQCTHYPVTIFMLSQTNTVHSLITWQLSSGEGLRIQLVRVLKTHQCLGCTRLILLIWEELSMYGHVRNEPCRERVDANVTSCTNLKLT